ncbi:MAG: hypothetical protein CMP20_02815 [Rickettsiales bacterium]|nr:hypothetical protein [Rickettsiales bacterium]
MRIQGIEKSASKATHKRLQEEITKRIIAIEKQIASLQTARSRRNARINAELVAANQRLNVLRDERMQINADSAAFPNVVDYVAWFSNVANVNFGPQADFDDAIAALQGAGDATFIDIITQSTNFLNTQGVVVADGTSVEQLIQLLDGQSGNDPDNLTAEQRRARELQRGMVANLEARSLEARGAAARYLRDAGIANAATMNQERLIQELERLNDQKALNLVRRLQNSLDRDVGQFGLQFAAQVEQFARSAQALATLASDANQRLVDGDYSDTERATLRNELVNTVQAFEQGLGIASSDALDKAIESLARLEATTPATIALAITPVDEVAARAEITQALARAKELLAVWEYALPVPVVPSSGDVANWVDRSGISGNNDALDKIRKLDEKISAINAKIRALRTTVPVDSRELQENLEQVRDGYRRQHANNQKAIQASEQRLVQVFQVEEGDRLEIPFRVLDTQNTYNVDLAYNPVNEKSARVIRQLVHELEDYDTRRPVDVRILESQNPDAAAARRYENEIRNDVELVRTDVAFSQLFTSRRRRQAQPDGYYKIVFPSLGAHQTATFTVRFTRVNDGTLATQDPVQATERHFKVIVYQKQPCVRTGKKFARLLNEYGDARWSTQPTDYERSLFFQRQVIGDVKQPVRHAAQIANQKQIEELRVERRNLVGFLGQYHIQQALAARDMSSVFFDAKAKQAQIANIDKRLQSLVVPTVQTPEQEREQRLEENWSAAGYQIPFRQYVDQLRARPKAVWIGRCSYDPLPTPPRNLRPRRRASESVSSGFAYPVYAPKRNFEVYNALEMWFMQAGQLVGFGGNPREFEWAKRRPDVPPENVIRANFRELKADEFGFDPQDPQYVAYLRLSVAQRIVRGVPARLTPFVPIAAKAGGFETDSESDVESDEPVAIKAQRAPSGFETDSDVESDDELLLVRSQPSAAVQEAMRILADSDEDEDEPAALVIKDDGSDYSYYSDDDAPPATLVQSDKGKEEVEDVPDVGDPFADKFSSSSDEAEDEEIVQRLNQLEATSNSVRSRWEQITNAELPKLSVMRASVKDVKAWVAQLSDHSKMARRASQELLSDSASALSELEEISNTLTQ